MKKNNYTPVKRPFKKWEIYVVNYSMNVGSEVNGNRPSIIYKDSQNTLGDDVTVIPLTSAIADKLSDKFDVKVDKDDNNKLFQNSYARLRQLKAVSISKIGKPVGEITNELVQAAIDAAMKAML